MTSWKNNNTLESRRLTEEILNPPKKTRKSRKVVVESFYQLRTLIDDRVKEFGPNCDLNDLDVSQITSMNRLFSEDFKVVFIRLFPFFVVLRSVCLKLGRV